MGRLVSFYHARDGCLGPDWLKDPQQRGALRLQLGNQAQLNRISDAGGSQDFFLCVGLKARSIQFVSTATIQDKSHRGEVLFL